MEGHADLTWEVEAPRRCNCLLWAHIHKWKLERAGRHGGYIAVRRSLNKRWINHRLWSRDLVHWYGYVPLRDPAKTGWARFADLTMDCYGLWFRGHVVEEQPAHSPEHRPHQTS